MTQDDAEEFDSLLRAVAASPNVLTLQHGMCGERFRLGRRLGAGSFGVVYEAEDLRDGGCVALKLLRYSDSGWLYRFKREFRALQGLVHPNLVVLNELFGDADRWFFTMELVDGGDFIAYARHGGGPGTFHEARLRDGLRQLFEGLAALHSAGKVHRDIKPSNVLVTREGRVVLIDLGLVGDAFATGSSMLGTPVYMAPEQAASQQVGPAGDLYAVGVMLYEVLTGAAPIQGPVLQILLDKQSYVPVPPLSIAPHVPADLSALCVALLQLAPAHRPSTQDVCRSLAAAGTHTRSSQRPQEASSFVGRRAELTELRAAFEVSRQQRLATIWVRGESGIGKTYLVRRFMAELRAEYPAAMLLEGRCYERETIPYKALDGIVDALTRRLSRMLSSEVAALLPTRRAMLARLFPALSRIPGLVVAAPCESGVEAREIELRQRAFLELRELFTRVALHLPTVIFIDDLQWADDDGLHALAEILREPDAPPLLLIGAQRIGPAESAETTQRLQAILSRNGRVIELATLGTEEACELATKLLSGTQALAVDPQRIAIEAGGHPLFVNELTRHAVLGHKPEEVTLDHVIWSRVCLLDAETRAVVQLVSCAGRPLQQRLAAAATRLDLADFQRRVGILRASNLVRTSGVDWSDLIEPYHDRVREVVRARLDSCELQSVHRSLALAIEAHAPGDAETLAIHWLEAGDAARAGKYAASAGDQASIAFAFERAAAWFQQALELLPESDPGRRALQIKLGDALVFAGRGALAAPHFEAAAIQSEAVEALELRRRAAEQLLRSGHFDRGIEASLPILAALDIRMPATRFQLIASLVYYGVLLRLRGNWFRERSPARMDASKIMRVDTCFAMAVALGFIEPVLGFLFHRRSLLRALAVGDCERISRSLGLEAAFCGMIGGSRWRRTQRLLHTSRELAQRSGSKRAEAYAVGVAGMAYYLNGRFRDAAAELANMIGLLEDGSMGLVHERISARMFMIQSLAFLGRFKELRRAHRDGLSEALARGDVYAAVNLRIGLPNLAWLIEDRPDLAEEEVQRAVEQWSVRGFHLEHFFARLARVQIKLYLGEVAHAHRAASELLTLTRRSLLWRMQTIRLRALYIRGASALGSLEQRMGDRKALLREVSADARAIERERMGWMKPFALVLRAGVALREGSRDTAQRGLSDAACAYAAYDMAAYAAAARDRAARLNDGVSVPSELAAVASFFREQDVVAPERVIRMLIPGLVA